MRHYTMHFNPHPPTPQKVGPVLCYRGGAQCQPDCLPGVPADLSHLPRARPGKDRGGHVHWPALRGSNLLTARLVPPKM